jgi:prevent-host-death family protein
MQVGTKQLKNRLSHYLRCVRRGEPVQVADRGEVIAVIQPVASSDDDDERALVALAADGAVTRGSGAHGDFAPVRARRGARLSRWIIEDRD